MRTEQSTTLVEVAEDSRVLLADPSHHAEQTRTKTDSKDLHGRTAPATSNFDRSTAFENGSLSQSQGPSASIQDDELAKRSHCAASSSCLPRASRLSRLKSWLNHDDVEIRADASGCSSSINTEHEAEGYEPSIGSSRQTETSRGLSHPGGDDCETLGASTDLEKGKSPAKFSQFRPNDQPSTTNTPDDSTIQTSFFSSSSSISPNSTRPASEPAKANSVTDTHVYDIPSPDYIYPFKGISGLYLGLEDKVRPPDAQWKKWQDYVASRLWTDLQEFQNKMKKSKKGRGVGPSLSAQLRMSGHAAKDSKKVALSPCIWILYDKTRWKSDIERFIEEIDWLKGEGFGGVEIRKGCPQLCAFEDVQVIQDLRFYPGMGLPIGEDTSLYLHVEQPAHNSLSACGLLSCATVSQKGVVISQRISRIGGLVSVDGKSLGITTAHAMFEHIAAVSAIPDDFEEGTSDSEIDDESDSASETSEESFRVLELEPWEKPLGQVNFCYGHQWAPIAGVGPTSFLGDSATDSASLIELLRQTDGRASNRTRSGTDSESLTSPKPKSIETRDHSTASSRHGIPDSDFTLWELWHPLQNTFKASSEEPGNVTSIPNSTEMPEGAVQLILGPDEAVESYLLPGKALFSLRGVNFETSKIRIPGILAKGCSGAWVVRGQVLYGMIIAAYENEPYAHMVSSLRIVHHILAAAPDIRSIQLVTRLTEPASHSRFLGFAPPSSLIPAQSGQSSQNRPDALKDISLVTRSPENAAWGPQHYKPQPTVGAILDQIQSAPPTAASPSYSSIGTSGIGGAMAATGLQDINLDDCIDRLLVAARMSGLPKLFCLGHDEIATICRLSWELFLSQPVLLELESPLTIVGDIHGQCHDLIRIFETCGFPPSTNYLFLGDYVDRGRQSLETILLLLCYKLKFPDTFFLLRGNHESANISRIYGFYDECKRRSSIKMWKVFIDVFNTLPMAAIVADKIFCVHGGLSPDLRDMNDIRNIARPTDVSDSGLLADLLWSDPCNEPDNAATDWGENDRGVSYTFGKGIVSSFLAKHDFDLICRAHQVVEDGYEFSYDRQLVTIFSAPNYCGEFDNSGAVMSVTSDLLCSFHIIKPLNSSLPKKKAAASLAELR